MRCIQVRHVFKSHQKSTENSSSVLNGITLTVDSGEIYALIGASGCGKTTLLSCIMGIQAVDSGEIRVFNRKTAVGELARKIGYMPQETALVPQLTIVETLRYFANLQLLSEKAFIARIAMISELLQLPPQDTVVKHLSGGQMRRMSLAVSIIHNPQLLILDEPTVGLDFVVRDRIWKFFQRQAQEANLTVLVTTHCLNEATKAHRCGFIRNGALTFNDRPEMLLARFRVETMDEALYRLCSSELENILIEDEELSDEDTSSDVFAAPIRGQVVKGLLIKDFHRIRRSHTELLTMFLGSFLVISLFFTGIGHFPGHLKLGIVTNEAQDCMQMLTESTTMLCGEEKHSCEFLSHIDEVEKVFYDSFTQAWKDFKDYQLIGLIVINANFSSSLFTDYTGHYGEDIEVYQDSTLYPLAMMLRLRIFNAFEDLIAGLAAKCEDRESLFFHPFRFEPMFKPSTYNFGISQSGIASVVWSFMSVFLSSSTIILHCRLEGVWTRTFVNGAKASEIAASYFIQCILISSIATAEIMLALYYFVTIGSVWLVFALVFASAINGYLVGFIVSVVSSSYNAATYFGTGIILAIFMVSGLIWPIEGGSKMIQSLARLLPFTMPANALHGVIFKGLGIADFKVASGLAFEIAYTVLFLLLTHVLLRMRQFR